MSTERKLVPKLRFPEFLSSNGWVTKTLSGVATVVMGSSPKSEYYNQSRNGLPLLQGNADIKDRLSAPRIFTSSVTKECRIGDILLSVRAPVGTVSKSIHHACIGRGIASIHAKHTNSQEFIYQWLLSYEPRWESISQGGTFDSVSSDDLKGVIFAVPSTPEQEKIADCLSSVDDLIAAQSRKVELLKTHKKGLMQRLFPREGELVPKLRFEGFEGEWESHTLGNVVTIFKGKGVAKVDVVENGMTPCIRYAELYTSYGEVISTVLSRTNIPVDNLILSEAGDVVIPASGETKEDIATCACVLDAGVALGGDLNVLRSKIDGRFFSYYLNGCKRPALAKVAQGDTVAHLYPSQISKLEIDIPPEHKEQQRIADLLTSLDHQISEVTQRLELLKNHKKGLMQGLFPPSNL